MILFIIIAATCGGLAATDTARGATTGLAILFTLIALVGGSDR